jgi:hypothetical protein
VQDESVDAVTDLQAGITDRRAYGSGITSINPKKIFKKSSGDFLPRMRRAAELKRDGALSFSYIWTIDSRKSMIEYIKSGVDGIMTNEPARLVEVARERNKRLATVAAEDDIPPSTRAQSGALHTAWVGSVPACGGERKDCEDRGYQFGMSSTKGDGALCAWGEKVLCGNKAMTDFSHVYKKGSWPVCRGEKRDCGNDQLAGYDGCVDG